ncbi:MAG: transcriptional regulator [Hyphobacterium sp.]|nr:MAG: transcriptional regulator [Hyphobacterium sp.]
MKSLDASTAFSALGHPARLALFQTLAKARPDTIRAGALAQALKIPPSTLTSHLQVLERSGLIRSARQSRTILYSVEAETARSLVDFLVEDCCQGNPELCGISLSPETSESTAL